MRIITTLAAAALIAGSATVALAQAGGAGGAGAGSGAGAGGSGGAPAAPQLDTSRPSATPPAVLRRGDEMAPMQRSNVSGVATTTRTVKHKKKSRMYR
jgi:hypothetical protein